MIYPNFNNSGHFRTEGYIWFLNNIAKITYVRNNDLSTSKT